MTKEIKSKEKKATYGQLTEFPRLAADYAKNKSPQTKFEYAIHKVRLRMPDIFKKYNELRQDIIRESAPTNEEGLFITNDKGDILWNPETSKKRDDKLKKLIESPCDIEPYYTTSLPSSGLSLIEIEYFEGLVISSEQAKAARALIDESNLPD